jgi:quercetin dioxygenase-like cupin family protein
MTNFTHYAAHTGARADKFFKSTLFESQRLLLGLNCLEPGQAQPAHAHPGKDKFYYVIEGQGEFTIGGETQTLGPGSVAWAPADVPHGIANTGAVRLVALIGMAPWETPH